MASQRKLGRSTDHRIAMLKNLVTSFLKYGKIVTTVTRAKETQSLAEKMITFGVKFCLLLKRKKLQKIYSMKLLVNIKKEMADTLEL